LHSAVRQEAAEWVLETFPGHTAQVVVATHSLASTGPSDDVVVLHVNRRANAYQVVDTTFDEADPVVREVGFTRGELLARHRAILYVEGETDRFVVEKLYGERLLKAGVIVDEIDSAFRAPGSRPERR